MFCIWYYPDTSLSYFSSATCPEYCQSVDTQDVKINIVSGSAGHVNSQHVSFYHFPSSPPPSDMFPTGKSFYIHDDRIENPHPFCLSLNRFEGFLFLIFINCLCPLFSIIPTSVYTLMSIIMKWMSSVSSVQCSVLTFNSNVLGIIIKSKNIPSNLISIFIS